MSVNYAEGLSKYENKGVCGLPEKFDDEKVLDAKIDKLADYIRTSRHVVFYCGAGVSTSAGIPDFRGPKGVWTLEKRGEKLDSSTLSSFDKCVPTFAHRAIKALIRAGYAHFIVSQNIDGLFTKLSLDRSLISELHGNYFVDECNRCFGRFIRNRPSPTMGCRPTGDPCPREPRPCRGELHDTILDWDQHLPEEEKQLAEKHSTRCDLAICLGTSMQIEPANKLPLVGLKSPNKHLVIVNLQPTKFDKRANLVVHHYIDNVMERLCKKLGVHVDEYNVIADPTKQSIDMVEWIR